MNATPVVPTWWPVHRVYFLGPRGIDADSLALTLSRRTASSPSLIPLTERSALDEVDTEGTLVVALTSPRHPNAAVDAVYAAERGLAVVVLGQPLPKREQRRLDAHGIPLISKNQVSRLVAAVNTGVLATPTVQSGTTSGRPAPSDLTSREWDLVHIMRAEPYVSRKKLAQRLGVTDATAKVHLANLGRKLGVTGRGRRALQHEVLRIAMPDRET